MEGSDRLYGIQAARGMAALAVLAYHLDFLHRGGFGVDVFFVISGFIISYTTRAERNWLRFLLKRLFRIVPAYHLVTLVIFAAGYFSLVRSSGTEYSLENLALSLAFIPHSDLNGMYRPIIGLGWTLNYEMVFYLVYCVAMAITHRFRDLLAVLILVAMLFLSPHPFYRDPILLEFALGMGLANIRYMAPALFAPRPAAGAILLVAITVLLVEAEPMALAEGGMVRFALFGPASMLAVTAWLMLERQVSGPAVHLGDWSYSLYLTHVYVLVLFARTLGPSFPVMLAAAGVAIALAAAMFVLFERPSNRFLRRQFLARTGPAAP